MQLRWVFILCFLFFASTPHAKERNLREHLQTITPEIEETEEVYWHQVPTWPRDENRRNPDPKYSANRGGFNLNINALTPWFPEMPTVSAEHLKKGEFKMRLGINHSSVHQIHEGNGYALTADYELVDIYAEMTHQTFERIQLGMILRALHYSAGRTDPLLNDFHEGLGLKKGVRGDAPINQYANRFTKDGKTLYDVKNNQVGMGDILLIAKFKALDETKNLPTISIVTVLKVPTASDTLGYNSDSWDSILGIAMTKQLTQNLKIHMNTGVTLPGTAKNMPDLSEFYSAMTALEYFITETFSIVLQNNFSTSPFENYDFRYVNGESWYGSIGLHVRLKNGIQLHFDFTDEFLNDRDSDFKFGWAWDF
ncbi:MAG: hypothetical protein A3B70_03405 [Deltaproteobacteria bacterium RIFCSPHIGHO2_02_FULL_40_11]|nr:MAG: hypothetical protein A3B70_03405 [Deltaproteobacteria bacterium RIFCSPHIGHO2_02_FULL_40_11]